MVSRSCCSTGSAARPMSGNRRCARSPIASRRVRYDLEGAGRSPVAGVLSIDGWVQDLKALLDLKERIDKARLSRPLARDVDPAALRRRAYPERVGKARVHRRQPGSARSTATGRSRTRGQSARRRSRRDRRRRREGGSFAPYLRPQARGGWRSCVSCSRASRPRAMRDPARRWPPPLAADVSAPPGTRCCCWRAETTTSAPSREQRRLGGGPAQRGAAQILEQCGHWHPIEQPAAVSQALREFL